MSLGRVHEILDVAPEVVEAATPVSLSTARGELALDDVSFSFERGALVVAAGTHDGVAYLPGSLDGVVRVELEWSCSRLAVEVVSGAGGGDTVCRASGYPRPVPGVPPARNLKGISFAVANVTGVLARELTGGSRLSSDAAIAALRHRQP